MGEGEEGVGGWVREAVTVIMMASATTSVRVETSDGILGAECMGWRGGNEKQPSGYGEFTSR